MSFYFYLVGSQVVLVLIKVLFQVLIHILEDQVELLLLWLVDDLLQAFLVFGGEIS